MSRVSMMIFVAVLAFGALVSSASAAPAGWMINKTNLMTTAALAATAKVDKKAKFQFFGANVECTGETFNSVGSQINEATLMGDVTTLEFTRCASITAGCKLASENVRTLPVLATVTLQGTLAIKATFTPVKAVFTTLLYEGEACALAGVQPVTGKATVLGPTGQSENTLQLIEVEATESSGELKVGSSPASLEGSALLRLASGQSWSFL